MVKPVVDLSTQVERENTRRPYPKVGRTSSCRKSWVKYNSNLWSSLHQHHQYSHLLDLTSSGNDCRKQRQCLLEEHCPWFPKEAKRQAVGEKPVVVMWPSNCPTGMLVWLPNCGVAVVWWLPNCPTGRTVARHKGLALLPLELPARTLFEHCPLLVAA